MREHDNNNMLHKFIMIICCTMPLIIIGALYFLKLQGTSLGSVLSLVAILLCSLLHLVMMPMMMRGMRNKESEENKSCH